MHPFHELVHKICDRPVMFVFQGKFVAAAAFLDGYDKGMGDVVRQMNAPSHDASLLLGFQRWLPERLGYASNVVWWGGIMHAYPDDAEAFQKLRELFDEYVAQLEAR